MDKTLGKDIANLLERKAFLADNCDAVEPVSYMKQFTVEKLQGVKEELANVSIEISDIEQELADFKEQIKMRVKPLKEIRAARIADVKAKAENVTEDCYKFVDRDQKMTAFYNGEGDLVTIRPATADELQPTLFQTGFAAMKIAKDGTNN